MARFIHRPRNIYEISGRTSVARWWTRRGTQCYRYSRGLADPWVNCKQNVYKIRSLYHYKYVTNGESSFLSSLPLSFLSPLLSYIYITDHWIDPPSEFSLLHTCTISSNHRNPTPTRRTGWSSCFRVDACSYAELMTSHKLTQDSTPWLTSTRTGLSRCGRKGCWEEEERKNLYQWVWKSRESKSQSSLFINYESNT